MVVVVAIILVVLGLLLPAARSIWEQRKVAGAENAVQGLLTNARASAMQASGLETGLFFFVNAEGEQQVVGIEQADPTLQPPTMFPWLHMENVFRLVPSRTVTLPAPMRVVPRYIVNPDLAIGDDDPYVFSDVELNGNDFVRAVPDNQAQRHRNFFSLVCSKEGELLVGRDVLILDEDKMGKLDGDKPTRDGFGDVTGLGVGKTADDPKVDQYFPQGEFPPAYIDPTGNRATVDDLITHQHLNGAAINFPSVDGVLVYDDSLLNGFSNPTDEAESGKAKREYLLRAARPFYVSRLTGAVVVGPIGGEETN